MQLRALRLAAWGILSVFMAGWVSAQSPPHVPEAERTLQQLLVEVRLLRQVLQATGLGSLRAQILLAQRQDHHDRVAQLERQIADARSEAKDTQAQIDQLDDVAGTAEQSLASESDPAKRTERETQVRQLGLERDQLKRRLESLRERELTLDASRAQEQAKLEEMQRGLGLIERQLEALQQAAAPAH